MHCFISRMALCFLVVASTVASAAAEERQLSASGEGYVDSVGSLFGRGEATHLGRSSLSVGGFTDFLSSGYFSPFAGSLESANRDFLDFVFDQEAYSFDPATGVVRTTVTFTGGTGRTGRFENVTGSAELTFVFDSNYQRFAFLLDGSIDY